MNKYVCDYRNLYIDFDKNNRTKFKSWDLYFSDKMLVRRVANELIATYDTEKYVVLNSIYCCLLKNSGFDLKFITGVINSKLISFWFKNLFALTDKLFPYIRKSQLEFIPIPNITLEQQQSIISLVEKILQNPSRKSDLEKEIDKEVYKLYSLTKEDIEIIES